MEQARRDIGRAVEAGAEMIELRLDALEEPADLPALISFVGVPIIATCRTVAEGGLSHADGAERATFLSVAADAGAKYLDLELETVTRDKRVLGIVGADRPGRDPARVILSFHDFQGRPDRLYNVLSDMAELPADVNKLVWTARTVRDNIEAFELLLTRLRPTIAICMGESGIISRILAKKFGAFLTFAPLGDESATAPGQVTISTLKRLYRWDEINSKTKVYGVVANPVGHSMSPAIHNAAFDAVDHDGVYLPLLVQSGYESFTAFMECFVRFEALDLCGLSVTLPHKENALRYLTEKGGQIEPLAQKIGAVNTIRIDPRDRTLAGINTDYAAILDTITQALGCQRTDLRGVKVGVLGAGGTGRTAVAALAHLGAKVHVFNRTADKAKALADEFGAEAMPWESLSASECGIYINATSLGMSPDTQVSPFGTTPPKLSGETLVFDTIYNPMKTLLLKQSEQAGAKVVGGVEMFVHQAAAQFKFWTKITAPVDVMRDILQQRLSKAN